MIGNIAFWLGIGLLVLTAFLTIRGELTGRQYVIGTCVGVFSSVMGLWNLGVF